MNVSDASVDPRLLPADGKISGTLAAKLADIRATYRVLSIPYLDTPVPDADPLVSLDKNSLTLVSTKNRDPLTPGNDTIYGGDAIGTASGNDIIFGDYGVIDQTPGTLRILNLNTPVNIVQVRTVRPADGGVDTIYGGDGSDTVLGGYAGDVIDAGQGDNIVVGDSGSLTYAAGGVLTILTTTDPTPGGDDRITNRAGNDRILGGVGNDTINGGDGNNIVIGDNGKLNYTAAGVPTLVTTSDVSSGGGDTTTTRAGGGLILGGAAR